MANIVNILIKSSKKVEKSVELCYFCRFNFKTSTNEIQTSFTSRPLSDGNASVCPA